MDRSPEPPTGEAVDNNSASANRPKSGQSLDHEALLDAGRRGVAVVVEGRGVAETPDGVGGLVAIAPGAAAGVRGDRGYVAVGVDREVGAEDGAGACGAIAGGVEEDRGAGLGEAGGRRRGDRSDGAGIARAAEAEAVTATVTEAVAVTEAV